MVFCSTMAGRTGKWTTLQLLVIFSLLSLSKGFEVAEEQWKELSPDVTALHRLSTPPQFTNSSKSRFDADRNPLSFLRCGNFTACVGTEEQDLSSHLGNIEKENRPQRAADHSTQYDHQQIIMLQDDEVVRKAATYLYEKHPAVSSVYVLDNNQRPKLINGKSEPLSENSRLVLVGHGAGDASGETRLSGYRARDVARIIQSTSRVSGKIQSTRVVACEVGSDEGFVESVLKELHGAGVETELHLWNTVVQVTEKGQIITEEVSGDGLQWRHEDPSKKVVATIDRNGEVTRRHESGSKGEIIFTTERNILMPKGKKTGDTKQPPRAAGAGKPPAGAENEPENQWKKFRDNWPEAPQTFIDPEVINTVDQNKLGSVTGIKQALEELEGLTWAMFHSEEEPQKMEANNLQNIENNFVIFRKEKEGVSEIPKDQKLKELQEVLQNCYEINSGIQTRAIIRHYGKKGENNPTYMMVKDWIFYVKPDNLYVFLVGKRLDNNERGNKDRFNKVVKLIESQTVEGKESYSSIKGNLKKLKAEKDYPYYVRSIFTGQNTNKDLETNLFLSWYFSASVIAESARNFRTFPLTLMVLDMDENHIKFGNKEEGAWKILFEHHPMARGGSWIDENMRGFSGSAVPDVSKRDAQLPKLKEVIERELFIFQQWKASDPDELVQDRMAKIIDEYNIFQRDEPFRTDYTNFINKIQQQENRITPPGSP
ncbi:uncharacterized protein PAE49_006507 [Odontesthes bonariensis]|uniref:uncharacterized protein LOC142382768 n=1 Tax=Odontesthes bonariensis TaxID=219752 RepID=UPI003F58F907